MAMSTAEDKVEAEAHRKTYQSIMRFSSEQGVPFAAGLAVFFTMLVRAMGWNAVLGFIVTYVFVHVIARTFFSSHS